LWGPAWGWGYWWGSYGYWGGGSPYYAAPYTTYYYAPPPIYYSTVTESASTTQDPAAAIQPVDGSSADASTHAATPPATSARAGTSNRAVSEYLALGDKSFREARYNDAVLSYAKAVEASPNDGVLHLVFADALFAAGEYHFAASALRRALELDPKLLNSVVDKRGFYGDPTDFDRQLAQLEKFLETHFADDDARLVLGANYLFAGRAAQAAEFLENSSSASVRESSAGQLVLARAHEVMNQTAPAPEKK
jgi:tetratricopeptide (TPR) repeat protein